MKVRVFEEKTGNEIHMGDSVISFREVRGFFVSVSKTPTTGKSGQVHVKAYDGYDYWNYPSVWGLRLEVEE